MNDAKFRKLEAEWNERLRADGFRDIESPSGIVPQPLSHGVTAGRTRRLAQLERDVASTDEVTFANAFEERVWALHLEGASNRAIAKKLCVYRKLVDKTVWALQARAQRRRGRRRDPESLRSEGLRIEVRMTREAMAAVEHLRLALPEDTTVADLVRRAILELARKTPMPTERCATVVVRTDMRKSA